MPMPEKQETSVGDPAPGAPAAENLPSVNGIPDVALQIAIASTGDILSERYGEHWRFTPIEAKSLATVWKPVIDMYLPKVGNHPIFAAMAATLVIIGPRIAKHELRSRKQGSTTDSGKKRKRENDDATGDTKPSIEGFNL